MMRRRIKSALYIDFDNIVPLLGREFVDKIPNWIAWLEDGEFEEGKRKRVLEQKRVYWNSHNEGHRRAFEEAGFEAQACPARISKKSTADMVIAIDVVQATYNQKAIEEYILLTTDTDFVTLIDKLDELEKKTIAVANENIPTVYTVFRDHADGFITVLALREALNYQRPSKSLVDMFRGGKRKPKTAKPIVATSLAPVPVPTLVSARAAATPASKPPSPPPKKAAAKPPVRKAAAPAPEEQRALLSAAAGHLEDMAKSTPGLPLGRATVIRAMEKRMPEFKTSGTFRFLGCDSYAHMIEHVVKIRPELQLIKYREGGMAIISPARAEQSG